MTSGPETLQALQIHQESKRHLAVNTLCEYRGEAASSSTDLRNSRIRFGFILSLLRLRPIYNLLLIALLQKIKERFGRGRRSVNIL